MFSYEFCELFKNTCFVEDLQTAGSETPDRSSRPEVFCEKGILRNFAKFTGKHLFQSLFFNKVAGGCLQIYLKKRLWHRCVPGNFAKFLRTPFSTEHLRWLLLTKRQPQSSDVYQCVITISTLKTPGTLNIF